MNKVILIGFVGNDPKMAAFEKTDKVKATFYMATSEKFGTSKRTSWHQVACWNGLALIIENLVKKGSHVAIEGAITYREYTNKEGEKKQFTEIVADKIEVLDRIKVKEEVPVAEEEAINVPSPEDDLPF